MTACIVLCGGVSDERQVSVASGQNVVRTLELPEAWFQAESGAVHRIPAADLLAHQRPFEVDFVPPRPPDFATLDDALDAVPEGTVIFLALHGTGGEDGTLQRALEARGIPYTGSDSTASAMAFDKDRAKEAVRGRIALAASRKAPDADTLREAVDTMLAEHERLVLKPLAGGSSRGLYFLRRGDDAGTVIASAAAARIPYVVEQFLTGRELTVGVADLGEGPFALPVIEIEVDAERSFDYAGKYLGAGTREICPARIPEELARRAQAAALEAHLSLGCFGYSRTDLIAAGDDVWFLELNTLPGLTTQSLVPQQLREAGIDFAAFLRTQIELAAARDSYRHSKA